MSQQSQSFCYENKTTDDRVPRNYESNLFKNL